MIANHPTYKQNSVGGDLTLTSCTKCTDAEVLQGKCNEGDATQGTSLENRNIAVGDIDGNPIPMTGWWVKIYENSLTEPSRALQPKGT